MRTAIDYAREAKDLREKLREVRADRDALRAALAQQVPEPCAYRLRDEEASTHYGRDMYVFFAANEFLSNERAEAVKAILEPLYAAPAAQQVPAVPGWQPIEAAPRNSEVLLLNGRVVVAGWFCTKWGKWVRSETGGTHSMQPTHWMPRPAAPLPTPADNVEVSGRPLECPQLWSAIGAPLDRPVGPVAGA